jgi:hypothetical protein
MRKLQYSIALLGVALAVAACDVRVGENGVSLGVGGKASDEWKRTYTVSPGGRVEVVNINGLIEAFPATGKDVEILARREVRAGSDEAARERLAKAEMIEEVAPDRVKVELKAHRENAGFGDRGGVSVTYRVAVPTGLNLSFRTENGAVRMENVNGRITAASTNGPVVGRGLSGSVDASTVNGGVEIGITALTADSRIETVNGPATVILAAGVGAEIDAAAVNGGVTTEDGLNIAASERSPRRLLGRLGDGGPKVVVHTTNGGVRVGMTSDFGRGRGRGRREGRPAGG